MSSQAYKRLNKEYKQIQANPPQYIIARPSESNILDWHYVITGPPGTPYENGQYHGRVTFPNDYPFKPPRIKMCTPSGRFEINQRLCLSMSDFHEESWNPSWSVATIITGLLSFMTGDERTTGSIVTSTQTKIQLAKKSKEFNTYSNPPFKEVFPDIWEQNIIDLKNKDNAGINNSNFSSSSSNNTENNKNGNDNANENQALKEVVKDINNIEDPEDKIRARMLQSATNKKDIMMDKKKSENLNNNNNNMTSYYLVIFAVIIGVVLKSIGLA
jgi:ubiquitin-conjugating enzyme E2 J2